jgi:hypothetical protein
MKVEVKLSLCFNWAPRRGGVLRERRYISTHSLSSALDEGDWSASRPGRLIPKERAPGTHWIGGWVGPRAVLDAVVERKIPSPRRESNPRTPIVHPVAQRCIYWAITALNSKRYKAISLIVLYSCETWCDRVRSEVRLLRTILGPEREEVAGGWRKLHKRNFRSFSLRYI